MSKNAIDNLIKSASTNTNTNDDNDNNTTSTTIGVRNGRSINDIKKVFLFLTLYVVTIIIIIKIKELENIIKDLQESILKRHPDRYSILLL